MDARIECLFGGGGQPRYAFGIPVTRIVQVLDIPSVPVAGDLPAVRARVRGPEEIERHAARHVHVDRAGIGACEPEVPEIRLSHLEHRPRNGRHDELTEVHVPGECLRDLRAPVHRLHDEVVALVDLENLVVTDDRLASRSVGSPVEDPFRPLLLVAPGILVQVPDDIEHRIVISQRVDGEAREVPHRPGVGLETAVPGEFHDLRQDIGRRRRVDHDVWISGDRAEWILAAGGSDERDCENGEQEQHCGSVHGNPPLW